MNPGACRLLAVLVLLALPVGCSRGESSPSVLKGHRFGITALAMSADGRFLASGDSNDELRVWDLSSLASIRELRSGQATIPLKIASAALSADGSLLASGFKGVQTWRVRDAERIPNPIQLRKAVRCLAFSPDSSFLAAGGEDQDIALWTLQPGGGVTLLKGHEGVVLCLAAQGGATLASGSEDHTIRLWDVLTHTLKRTIVVGSSVLALSWSSDGHTVYSWGEDLRIRWWNPEDGKELGQLEAVFNTGSFSPDAGRFAGVSADGDVTVLNVATGKVLQEFKKGVPSRGCVCVSREGKVALGRMDGSIALYSVR